MQVFSVFISTDDSSIRVKKNWQIQVKANRLGNVSLSTQVNGLNPGVSVVRVV